MVDNIVTHLGKTIHIGFSGSEIAAFDGVVKKTPDTVTIILVVFGGVDPALSRNAVSTPGAVLNTEVFYVIAEFAEGCRGRTAGKTGSYHNDIIFSFIGRIDKLKFKTVLIPFFRKGT